MFASLRTRLWLTYFVLIAVILSVIGLSLFFYLIRNPVLYRANVEHLRISLAAITVRMDLFDTFPERQVQRIVDREDQVLKVRVQILRADGTVLVDSRQGNAPALAQLQPPLKPQNEVQNQPLFTSDDSGTIWLYRLGQLNDQYFVRVAIPRPRAALFGVLRDEFVLLVLRTGGIALLLALILGILMARWIAAPLQRMAVETHRVATGNFQDIPLEGPREVQELAQAFNQMTHRVQASQQSQRDFVANVSHELKTPLTSIQGFAQAILDGTASTPETLQQAATVISNEAARMYRLVLDLLTLARLDAGTENLQREPLDLAALLREVTDKLAPQARQSGVEIQLELQPLSMISGDADRLAQVFTNLVENGLKYTPAGGQVMLSASQANGVAEVVISDTGPGISAEEQSRVFERFYQADKSRRGGSGRGAGLGLAIARELILAQGGTIELFSVPGKGSKFVVKIPTDRL